MKKILVLLAIMVFAVVACGESKPSKGEVKASLKELVVNQSNADTEETKKQIGSYVNCIVDEVYDDLSAATLRGIVEAKSAEEYENETSEKETEVLNKATETCAQKLGAQ